MDVDSDGNLAYLVENDITVCALTECVRDCSPNVSVAYGSSALRYDLSETDDGPTTIHLDNGDKISTRLLVSIVPGVLTLGTVPFPWS